MSTKSGNKAKTPAHQASSKKQDKAPVAKTGELSKSELDEVSGGIVRQ